MQYMETNLKNQDMTDPQQKSHKTLFLDQQSITITVCSTLKPCASKDECRFLRPELSHSPQTDTPIPSAMEARLDCVLGFSLAQAPDAQLLDAGANAKSLRHLPG